MNPDTERKTPTSEPYLDSQSSTHKPCPNEHCCAGIIFEVGSGRIKPCRRCNRYRNNVEARFLVQRLLDLFKTELTARGGSIDDVLARLEESPELLAEHLHDLEQRGIPLHPRRHTR